MKEISAYLYFNVASMPSLRASTILSTVSLLTTVTGLGINCRGSGLCGFATIENTSGVNIVQVSQKNTKRPGESVVAKNLGSDILSVHFSLLPVFGYPGLTYSCLALARRPKRDHHQR